MDDNKSATVRTAPGADPGREAAVVTNLADFDFPSVAVSCHCYTCSESAVGFFAVSALSLAISVLIAAIT